MPVAKKPSASKVAPEASALIAKTLKSTVLLRWPQQLWHPDRRYQIVGALAGACGILVMFACAHE